MKIAIAAALTAASIAAPAPAAEATGEYRVRAAAIQLAMPNRVAEGTRRHAVRDIVLDVPLLWAGAATLREPVRIEGHGEAQELPAGTVLPMQMIGPSGAEPVPAFCTPRRAAERAAERGALGALLGGGSLWRGIIRRATDRQACVIDADGDGRVESSVILGDGPPEARRPRPLAPAAVELAQLQPIGERDRFRIKLVRVDGRGRWAEFELQIEQQGDLRRFDEMSGRWGRTTRITRVRATPDGAGTGNIAGTLFNLVSADGAARSAEIRWSEKPARDLAIVIPDALQIVVR